MNNLISLPKITAVNYAEPNHIINLLTLLTLLFIWSDILKSPDPISTGQTEYQLIENIISLIHAITAV